MVCSAIYDMKHSWYMLWWSVINKIDASKILFCHKNGKKNWKIFICHDQLSAIEPPRSLFCLAWFNFELIFLLFTESIRSKIRELVKELNLNGVSFWALDSDDFTGLNCGQGRYPLISAAVDEMNAWTLKTRNSSRIVDKLFHTNRNNSIVDYSSVELDDPARRR